MPLIRKPGATASLPEVDAGSVLRALASPVSDERWSAARAAADVAGADAAIADALLTESDARVREAMMTSLAKIGSPRAIESLITLLRSDAAEMRTGALDALKLVRSLEDVVTQLIHDADSDVRNLCCDLARSLPASDANRHLCELVSKERDMNVCAAAIDVLAEVGDSTALDALADCAQRFHDSPFLLFAVGAVTDRIKAKSVNTRD